MKPNLRPTRLFAALAMAGTCSATWAQSSVTLYGLLDASVQRRALAGEAKTARMESGTTSTSFWALRGSEDIGGGVSVQFDIGSFFRVDVGSPGRSDTDTFWSRSSWVGVRAPWGTVRLGRQTTLGFLTLTRHNAWGTSSAYSPSMVHNYLASATQPMMTGAGASDSSWTNVVSYATPSFGGAAVTVFAAPGEGAPGGRRLGASFDYLRSPLSVGLTVEKISKANLNFSKPPANLPMNESDLVSLGVSYDFKVVKVFAHAVRTELTNATTTIDLDSKSVGVAVPVGGAGRVLASYAQTTKEQSRVAEQERKTLTVGYEHDLSKRTNLYALVMNDKMTGLADGTSLGVGIRHRF